MAAITCIEDLRLLARRRVPRMFYDYADAGSWTEATYRANSDDFARILLRQRVGINTELRTTRGTMAGQEVQMPVALAPTGLAGMQHADGEIHAARAAEKAGVPFTLSTMSICSIEDVAAHTSKPFWFQLYVLRDRAFTARLIERAGAAGCEVLLLTLDLTVFGQRHKDIRNGMTAPPKMTLKNVINLIGKPRWCIDMLRTPRRGFGNIVGHASDVSDMATLAGWTAQQFDSTLCWDDVAWVRKRWPGKLIVKGIMDPDDARLALAHGADAIIVSNHGGRQLDGAPSSIAALSPIVAAVGDQVEVHMDGGIRSGQDVFRALALGAKGVYIGRPFLYGLGAMGEAGVSTCLQLIKRELDLTMAFCGANTLADIDRSALIHEKQHSVKHF